MRGARRAYTPLPRWGLVMVVTAAIALVYVLAVWTPFGLMSDAGVVATVEDHRGLSEFVGDGLVALSLPLLAVALVTLVAVAVRTRRVAAATRAAIAVLLAAATAEVLKVLLPGRPGDPTAPLSSPLDMLNPGWWAQVYHGPVILSGSFPGGHAAIATGVALALLTAMRPPHSRRLAVPLMTLAAVVAGATVVAGWHRPSDAFAGMLLALAWWLALVPDSDRRRGQREEGPPSSWLVVKAIPDHALFERSVVGSSQELGPLLASAAVMQVPWSASAESRSISSFDARTPA
jgi:membrane-associated phospholipid phosphatase